MTGQEALDFSLAQCNTSQQSIDTNTDAYAAWALRTVNFACANLYYFIQARLASSDRETGVSTHDFEPFNAAEYPDGSPDVLLLQPEQEIVRLYAKYTADGDPVQATFLSLNSLPFSPEYYARSAAQTAPFYIVLNKEVQVFPKPAETVAGGIIVHQQAPYIELEALNQPIQGIPGDYQDDVILSLQMKVYERLRRYDDVQALEQRYERRKSALAGELAGRGGRRSKTVWRQPVYL